jgi:hypothetical protein
VASKTFPGVLWDSKAGKWKTRVKLDGRDMHVGAFDSEEAAAEAYTEALVRIKR